MKGLRFLLLGMAICLASGVKAQDGVYVYIEAGCSIDNPESNPNTGSYIWAVLIENGKAYDSWKFKLNASIASNIKTVAKAYEEGRVKPSILNDGGAKVFSYDSQKSSYSKKVYSKHNPEFRGMGIGTGGFFTRAAWDDLLEFTNSMNTMTYVYSSNYSADFNRITYQRISEEELSKFTKSKTFYE